MVMIVRAPPRRSSASLAPRARHSLPQAGNRAALDRTADGGCPYI